MPENKDLLKDEELEKVAGGFDPYLLRDCEQSINATKEIIQAYETVLSGDHDFEYLKECFNSFANLYSTYHYQEAYNKIIALKQELPRYRNRGDESLNKFVGDLESNVLAIDYLLREFCTGAI